MAAAYIPFRSGAESAAEALVNPPCPIPARIAQLLEFSGVFRGRELTRKDRKLACGIASIDALLHGGIPRGRVSEIIGRTGSGRTTLAAAFAADATRRGEVAAWIDASGSFDPASIEAAGADLARVLWASLASHPPHETDSVGRRQHQGPLSRESLALKAAEMVLEAGGFGLVVVDFGDGPRAIALAAALRLARAAERSGAAVIAIAPYRMCGTFAALSVAMRRARAIFGRIRAGSPAMFDGLAIEATVARNKLGGSGASTHMEAAIDPAAGNSDRPRIGEKKREEADQNFKRASLCSALTKVPHPTTTECRRPLPARERHGQEPFPASLRPTFSPVRAGGTSSEKERARTPNAAEDSDACAGR